MAAVDMIIAWAKGRLWDVNQSFAWRIRWIIEELKRALRSYESDHPRARIELYRQNTVCVRIRVIDPGFAKMSKKERNDFLWKYFDVLSDDAQGEISMLLALTPAEAKKDLVNCEFDDPPPSML